MKALRLIALATILGLVAAACGGDGDGGGPTTTGSGGGLTNVTFRLDWITDGSHTCFYVALSNGYFEDEGLNVEILEGAGSGTAANLVANGSNTFGFSDAGVVVSTINDGAAIKMVAGIFERSPSVIIAKTSSGITTAADLSGKSIGATAGEAPLQLLPAYLQASGVDPDSVEVVNIDPAAKVTALLEDRVDAIVGYSSSDLPVAQSVAGEELAVQYYADAGVVTMSNGIITSNEQIANNPDVVQGFVTAVQKGFEFCEQDPAAAVQLLVDRFPQTVNPDQAAVALNEVLGNLHTERTADQPIGYMDPADWEDTLSTLQQYSGLAEAQAPETYFTNEFIATG
jgi:NitT/TauT family transport system substrate-binding protein